MKSKDTGTPTVDQVATNGLHGKVAVVTGAGAGIGSAAALLLGVSGVSIGVLGRTASEVHATCEQIIDAGGTAMALVADISKPAAMQRSYDKLMRKWGRLDIVFANAGVNGTWTGLEQLTVEEWDETIAINLRGTFLTVKFAVPFMKKQGGSIIITSSVNGTRMFSNTGATAYATSKAGQVAFARMCALELASNGIRVNTICPGAITTQIDQNTKRRGLEGLRDPVIFPKGGIPLTHGQPGSVKQVAELVKFLASDLSSHITGTEVFIDGAESLIHG